MSTITHAMVVQPKAHPIYAGEVWEAVRSISSSIESIGVSGGSIPWIVYVHCTKPLSNQEQASVQAVLNSFEGTMYLDLERTRE